MPANGRWGLIRRLKINVVLLLVLMWPAHQQWIRSDSRRFCRGRSSAPCDRTEAPAVQPLSHRHNSA